MTQTIPSAYGPGISRATFLFTLILGVAGIILVVLFTPAGAHAGAFPQDKLPGILKPWCDWVLHEEKSHTCPLVWNQAEERECVWPSSLRLDATASGATFTFSGYLDTQAWIVLPGSTRYWPQGVTSSGQDAVVLRHHQRPAVLLEPGPFHLEGKLVWEHLPDALPLPPDVALVNLRLENAKVPNPRVSRGNLQLRHSSHSEAETRNTVSFQVYRHLEDRIPQILTTRIEVRVSGDEREITTAKVLPEDFVPLDIDTRVPARLEDDGRLHILAQAGEYSITLRARHRNPPAETQEFIRPPADGPWAQEEIWAVERRGDLRTVRISGAPPLDPAQTDMPAAWKQLPTYLMDNDTRLTLTQEERGLNPSAADRLELERRMWLDFSGEGYSVRDHISGTLDARTRLNSSGDLALGRALLNGTEQFITRVNAQGADGIEVRQQHINLEADSRIDPKSIASIPALGWDFNPDAIRTELNLPPGWRVLAAVGADSTTGTWVQQWSLLDLFVVLLLSIGFARLWGWKCGILALLGLMLTYQEPHAPRFIWLHLLGAAALLRVAPHGHLRRLVRVYLGGAGVWMAVVLLIFSAQQIRSAVYPQLEPLNYQHVSRISSSADMQHKNVVMEQTRAGTKMLSATVMPQAALDMPVRTKLPTYSTTLETQTGPGVPTWEWRKIRFVFNTSVTPEQRIKLIFSSPSITRIALVGGVMLVLYMFGRICLGMKSAYSVNNSTRPSPPVNITALAGIFASALALAAFPASADAHADERENSPAALKEVQEYSAIPSPEMLDELRQRLLRPPECAPDCAALQHLRVNISAGTLSLEQQIHSATLSAVPLAFPLGQLTPARISSAISPHPLLLHSDPEQSHAQLWARVESGITTLKVEAPVPADIHQVEIPLPLRAGRISIEADGWEILNRSDDPGSTATISLRRKSETEKPKKEQAEFPLYAEVNRRLNLGVEWQVETTLKRMSTTGKAGVIAVPLLEGEQVVTPGIQTRDGTALIEVGPDTDSVQWRSRLDRGSPLILENREDRHFHEVWQLELSPLWHAEFSGTPLIYHYQNGRWLAQWHPRTGERLTLHIERPQGSPGEHITVENVSLRHKRGELQSESELHLKIRSSIATRHTITLPDPDAKVKQVRRDGRDLRIEQDGNKLTLALVAGTQQLEILWDEEHNLNALSTTPALNLNAPAVNIDLNLTLPHTRWVLFTGGPLLGPAVLFWGVVLVLGLAALALGRYAPTPLRWWHWFILGAGLSQAPLPALLLVVFWLILLGVRKKYAGGLQSALTFNSVQIGLGIFSICALLALLAAVQQGLLGMPEMQVAGQNSNAWNLNWYQDRSNAVFPTGWVFSLPILAYRALMLLWALWLALALLQWLRWGCECFSSGNLWRPLPRRKGENP
jgi:hypothetical protein